MRLRKAINLETFFLNGLGDFADHIFNVSNVQFILKNINVFLEFVDWKDMSTTIYKEKKPSMVHRCLYCIFPVTLYVCRQHKPRRTPILPRTSSNDDMKGSQSVTLLKHIPGYQSPMPGRHRNENVVYAEVHQQPKVCVTVAKIYS